MSITYLCVPDTDTAVQESMQQASGEHIHARVHTRTTYTDKRCNSLMAERTHRETGRELDQREKRGEHTLVVSLPLLVKQRKAPVAFP